MKTAWKLFFTLIAVLLIFLLWQQLPMAEWITQFRQWILALGTPGVVAFVLLYVLVTALLGPASALSMTAGLAYGAWGFLLVVVSGTLSASLAFLLGRYVARERVTRWMNQDARLRALNTAMSAKGWRVVGLMRLSPMLPFGVQNYLFSVTRIRFVPYVFATLIGIMPVTAMYVYIGSLGQVVGTAGILQWTMVLAGLVATVVVAWLVGRQARTILTEKIEDTADVE